MGLIRTWIREMGNIWDRAAQGDMTAFLPPTGSPGTGGPGTGPGYQTGTGDGWSTGTGDGWGPGTGDGNSPVTTPDGRPLTEQQLQMLMRYFHDQYRRYPLTQYEFSQWLRENW